METENNLPQGKDYRSKTERQGWFEDNLQNPVSENSERGPENVQGNYKQHSGNGCWNFVGEERHKEEN